MRVLVAGGNGFLGKHLVAMLRARGDEVTVPIVDFAAPGQANFLRDFPVFDVIFNLMGNVGGIEYNRSRPADLFIDNFLPSFNLLTSCRMGQKTKIVQVGSVCEYPKFTPVPFNEDNLWIGYPEETNAPYGIAKRALLELGQALRAQYGVRVIHPLLANLYGPGDNYSAGSHVISALIDRFSKAKDEVVVFGTGRPTRDFLYVEDAAKAIVKLSEVYDQPGPINIGTGKETSIFEIANTIRALVNPLVKISWDHAKPDGQPRRVLDVSRALSLGISNKTDIASGLKKTVECYISSMAGVA